MVSLCTCNGWIFPSLIPSSPVAQFQSPVPDQPRSIFVPISIPFCVIFGEAILHSPPLLCVAPLRRDLRHRSLLHCERRTMNECPYQTRVGKAPSRRLLRNFHACQGLPLLRCHNGSCKRHPCHGCEAERRRPKAAGNLGL